MFIVDRIEGDYAVIEMPDKSMVNLPLSIFPNELKEGDVIKIIIDNQATQERKARIDKKINWS